MIFPSGESSLKYRINPAKSTMKLIPNTGLLSVASILIQGVPSKNRETYHEENPEIGFIRRHPVLFSQEKECPGIDMDYSDKGRYIRQTDNEVKVPLENQDSGKNDSNKGGMSRQHLSRGRS